MIGRIELMKAKNGREQKTLANMEKYEKLIGKILL